MRGLIAVGKWGSQFLTTKSNRETVRYCAEVGGKRLETRANIRVMAIQKGRLQWRVECKGCEVSEVLNRLVKGQAVMQDVTW